MFKALIFLLNIFRKKNALKEAKKLKHFLEDYDDEKDDPKYYKLVVLCVWVLVSD